MILKGEVGSKFEDLNLRIDLQNEFLLARIFVKVLLDGKPQIDPRIYESMKKDDKVVPGRVVVCVPDIITILDQEFGHAISSDEVCVYSFRKRFSECVNGFPPLTEHADD